jgi:tetratricopeptide (TPR) repeat protein
MMIKLTKVLVFLMISVFAVVGIASADATQAAQYLAQGSKFLQAKQYDKAIQYYNYSAKLNPTDSAYYYAGIAYYMKGQKAESLSSFQNALKVNPANVNAKKMIAKLQGGAAPAAGGNSKASQYLMMGHKYLKAGQYDNAIKYYNASAQTQPNYLAYQFMGTAYYHKGDMENAKISYQKSLQLNPNNPGVRNVLAKLNAGGAGNQQTISQQMGVHPLLLAAIFAGCVLMAFLF